MFNSINDHSFGTSRTSCKRTSLQNYAVLKAMPVSRSMYQIEEAKYSYCYINLLLFADKINNE